MKPGPKSDSTEELAFLEWARTAAAAFTVPDSNKNLEGLRFLDSVIGEVKVVSLGENAHYLHEWNLLRMRLFQYLVKNHGFTTFVLEAGLVEGRLVHDYVLGADVEWESVVTSITCGWGAWAEVQELVRWMREYNSNAPEGQKLKFYGTDGSGNWADIRNVYASIHSYLLEVDRDLAGLFYDDFESEIRTIQFQTRDNVSPATWQSLIAKSSLLVSRMEQGRVDYCLAKSKDDYEWALRFAKVMRDQILNMAQTDPDFEIGFRAFWNTRDAAMADQLEWIINREGSTARILVGAHNSHLQQYPVRLQKVTSMGSYLSNRIGRENLLFIGSNSAFSVKGENPLPTSNQDVYSRVGPDCFFLDFRTAPASGAVNNWLQTERMDRSNLSYQPVAPGIAWDCLFYHHTVSIAQAKLPASYRVNPGKTDSDRIEDYIGRYLFVGFVGTETTLEITREGEKLFADGRADKLGELFPPFRIQLTAGEGGRFFWPNWPANIQFLGNGRTEKMILVMPGMGIYPGRRIES